jgi:hypothetical protein
LKKRFCEYKEVQLELENLYQKGAKENDWQTKLERHIFKTWKDDDTEEYFGP